MLLNGRFPVDAPLARTEHGYRYDEKIFEAAIRPNTKIFILSHPHNPTGNVWSEASCAARARSAPGRGQDIAADALALGAHRYIDTEQEDGAEALKALGGAKAILSTPAHAAPVAALMPGLASEGRMVLLGVGKDPLPVAMGPLIGGERGVIGSITGSPHENERTLDFSVLTDVRSRIETMPLEQAADAYHRMRSGDVKFRMVLTMKGRTDAYQ